MGRVTLIRHAYAPNLFGGHLPPREGKKSGVFLVI